MDLNVRHRLAELPDQLLCIFPQKISFSRLTPLQEKHHVMPDRPSTAFVASPAVSLLQRPLVRKASRLPLTHEVQVKMRPALEGP